MGDLIESVVKWSLLDIDRAKIEDSAAEVVDWLREVETAYLSEVSNGAAS
jgi:hypothetical protein